MFGRVKKFSWVSDRTTKIAHEQDQHRRVSTRRRPHTRCVIEEPLSPRIDVRAARSSVSSGEVCDPCLGRFVAREPRDDPASEHDADAIAEQAQLRGLEDETSIRDPVLRSADQEPVDLRLGSNVDATCRLVEHEHAWSAREPLAEHDLLLVPARQRRDGARSASGP